MFEKERKYGQHFVTEIVQSTREEFIVYITTFYFKKILEGMYWIDARVHLSKNSLARKATVRAHLLKH